MINVTYFIITIILLGMVTVRSILLIATDGLFDMMSNERAVEIAFDHWGDPSRAAKQMVSETGKLCKIS